jgi:type II secretory pathway pseudopilin PulG
MTTQAARGFTIIEVMLFLAVTGLLTIGVLVGSSRTITQQRYRDSVSSLKSLIQEQYSQTANVVNGDVQNPVCNKRGNTLDLDPRTLRFRGTSECLILGRYLLIEPKKVTAYDVIGLPNSDNEGADDIAALRDYSLTLSENFEAEEIAWDATVVRPRTTTGMTTSVLVARSPLSGSTLTFIGDGNQLPSALIDIGNMVQKDLCIDSGGGAITSRRLAVRINARATSPSSVEIPLERDSICD